MLCSGTLTAIRDRQNWCVIKLEEAYCMSIFLYTELEEEVTVNRPQNPENFWPIKLAVPSTSQYNYIYICLHHVTQAMELTISCQYIPFHPIPRDLWVWTDSIYGAKCASNHILSPQVFCQHNQISTIIKFLLKWTSLVDRTTCKVYHYQVLMCSAVVFCVGFGSLPLGTFCVTHSANGPIEYWMQCTWWTYTRAKPTPMHVHSFCR